MDSCGVFVIGPWQGVRLCYDCSLLDIVAPKRRGNNSRVMEIIRVTAEKEVERRPWAPREYWIEEQSQVQGYPLESYLPKNKAKQDFIRWTFDCVEHRESAVAEQKRATKKKLSLYPIEKYFFAAVPRLSRIDIVTPK